MAPTPSFGCQTLQITYERLGSMPNDPRRQGPMYVEARGYLQPAVDFYARAVRAADSQGLITGDILSSVRITIISIW